MDTKQEILLIEDSSDDAFLVERILNKHLYQNYEIRHKMTMAEAEEYIQAHKNDVQLVLLDLGLPDTRNGRDAFERIKKHCVEIPIVILTGLEDHTLALNLVKEGAEDFINKNLLHDKPKMLRDVVEFAICRKQLVNAVHKKHQQKLDEKDQVISWMSGDYSVKK